MNNNNSNRVIPNPANADLVTQTIRIGNPGQQMQDINSEYQVMSILISKTMNKVPFARIVILDGSASTENFEISEKDDFIPGKALDILAGYHSQENTIFKGIITKHSIRIQENRAKILEIECRDEVVKLSVNRKNAYFSNKSDKDVLEEILDTYRLDYDIDLPQTQHEHLVQYYTSDWDFLLCRAEANGTPVIVDQGKVQISPPDLNQEPTLTLIFGGNLLEFEAEMDARSQFDKIETQAWNPSEQNVSKVENAAEPSLAQGNLDTDDLAKVISAGALHVQHAGYLPEPELQSWADAQALRTRLSRIRARAKYQGNADIVPGMLVKIQGVGDRFNGIAYVSGIRHEISKGNWVSHVQLGLSPDGFGTEQNLAAPQANGLIPPVNGLLIGIVTQLENDPQGEHRIKVRIPLINAEDEGIWTRIASLDAGENRGTFFRPELNDEVVLGFLQDDPRHPVILGMLNSSAKPAPIEGSNDNHEKGFVTRSGIKLLFNDDKPSVSIETPGGKKIALDEDAGVISLEDENNNRVVINSEGISLESASDIKLNAQGDVSIQGTKISFQANSELSAQASARASLISNGDLTIQGLPVRIN